MMQKKFHNMSFEISASSLSNTPNDHLIELAFIGRSNVGKSSLLNALASQRKLAKTSKTPGRTQLINFFRLSDQHRLVDLPGLGYAEVSQKSKESISSMISEYLAHREQLQGLLHLMDARHPLQKHDLSLLEFMLEYRTDCPLLIVLTKADKLNRNDQNKALQKVRQFIQGSGLTAKVVLCSSLKKQGMMELQQQIAVLLGN